MKVELKDGFDREYLKEVDNFGGFKPEFEYNNLNVIHIHWRDVQTDGKGNVLDMPLLKSKQCFGRIEYRVRHGHEDSRKPIPGRPDVKNEPKCSRCPISTKDSCDRLVAERIKSSPEIKVAMLAWRAACEDVENEPEPFVRGKIYHERFTGDPFGYLWQAVRFSIVNHGRFESSNDNAVEQQIKEARCRRRQNQAKSMRALRGKRRAELKAKQGPPPEEFVEAAWDECLKRTAQLFAARDSTSAPRQLARLNDQGCELTAYAWFWAEICKFQWLPFRPAKLAAWLLEHDLAPGQTKANLKTRLKRDLERAVEIEANVYGAVWQRFDPDAVAEF